MRYFYHIMDVKCDNKSIMNTIIIFNDKRCFSRLCIFKEFWQWINNMILSKIYKSLLKHDLNYKKIFLLCLVQI